MKIIDKLKITAAVAIFSINALYFILGVVEAIYISKQTDRINKCWNVREWLIAACVLNIIVPLFNFCGIGTIIELFIDKDSSGNNKDNSNNSNISLKNIINLSHLIIAIWSAVAYYNIDETCKAYWEETPLWIFVKIHIVLLWFSVALFGITIVCVPVYMCKVIYDANEEAKRDTLSTRLNNPRGEVYYNFRGGTHYNPKAGMHV